MKYAINVLEEELKEVIQELDDFQSEYVDVINNQKLLMEKIESLKEAIEQLNE